MTDYDWTNQDYTGGMYPGWEPSPSYIPNPTYPTWEPTYPQYITTYITDSDVLEKLDKIIELLEKFQDGNS